MTTSEIVLLTILSGFALVALCHWVLSGWSLAERLYRRDKEP
jgi:hypothetical protein